jgi:CMP-N,N'-diacetyllegionaminic acid synthase
LGINIIATICARGGSKGLPGKNIRLFEGKPLIAWTIETALSCPSIEGKVYVSTDDEQIAAVSRSFGARVPFLRPAQLATDDAPKLPVIEHLVQAVERSEGQVDYIVDLQPTSPLRLLDDLNAAIELAKTTDLVVGVTEPSHNPYYSLARENDEGRICQFVDAKFTRRQDVPRVYGLNGSIYVWRRNALPVAIERGFWNVSIKPYCMPRWRSVDIDDLEDFELASWYAKRFGPLAGSKQ